MNLLLDTHIWIWSLAALNMSVAAESEKLELDWKDPADRFIAATAVVYDLILVTRDSHFQKQSGFRVIKG